MLAKTRNKWNKKAEKRDSCHGTFSFNCLQRVYCDIPNEHDLPMAVCTSHEGVGLVSITPKTRVQVNIRNITKSKLLSGLEWIHYCLLGKFDSFRKILWHGCRLPWPQWLLVNCLIVSLQNWGLACGLWHKVLGQQTMPGKTMGGSATCEGPHWYQEVF